MISPTEGGVISTLATQGGGVGQTGMEMGAEGPARTHGKLLCSSSHTGGDTGGVGHQVRFVTGIMSSGALKRCTSMFTWL